MHLPLVCHLARGVVVLVLFSLAGKSQTTPQQKQAPGTISGTVSIKGKRAPGVTVGLRKSDLSNPYGSMTRTTTDQDGKYRLTNVAMGTYEVIPSVPAYVNPDQTPAARRIVIGEGENVEDINFELVRGGVITGKITEADGRPAIQHQVNLYRANSWEQQGAQQRQPIFPVMTLNTDDRGIYRMFGIVAGRYKVAVGRGEDTFSGPNAVTRATYKQIFYPDANDQTKASIIEVTEGSEATNIDITLGRPVQTYSASGRVVDGEKGLPIPNIRFTVQRVVNEGGAYFGNLVTSSSKGEFVIDNLLSGKYSFYFMPQPNNELRAEATTFEVLDQDMTGLIVKMMKGETMSGVIVPEREDRKAMARIGQTEIRVYVSGPSGPAGNRSTVSSVASDGSFHLNGLSPGTANFYLADSQTRMQIKGMAIVRIERDGVIQPRGIEIKEGDDVTGVRIVVSYGEATLRGTINVENGPLPPGSQFTVRLSRPGEMGNSAVAIGDARGSFVIEGLAPGVFEATVSLVTDRKVRRSVKQQVSVQEAGVTNVVITFDVGEPKSP